MFKKTVSLIIVIAVVVAISLIFTASAKADCPLAHTHIGKNPTWRPADWGPPPSGAVDPEPTDDNKLWFFSLPPIHSAATPDWPSWGTEPGESTKPFLKLVPDLDDYGNPTYKPGDATKQLHTCSFMYSKANGYGDPDGTQHLNGWHSAHGPQGAWNLESIDEPTVPDWDIYIVREGISANLLEDDFFMLTPNETAILTTDGSESNLEKMWLEDKSAWGFHEHMEFEFWLDEGIGDIVSVMFSAYDAGGLYDASDNFTMQFEVIPEPATLSLLALGCLGLLRHYRK